MFLPSPNAAATINPQPHGEFEFHLSRTTAGLIQLFCGQKLATRHASMEFALRKLGQACIDEQNGGRLSWLQCRDILRSVMSAPRTRRVITWLVAAGVLVETDSGAVRIHNYDKNNRTLEQWRAVKEQRRLYWRDAKRAQRAKLVPKQRTKRSFELPETTPNVPNSANVLVSIFKTKQQSPSQSLPSSKYQPMTGVGGVLHSIGVALLPSMPTRSMVKAKNEGGEGDFKKMDEVKTPANDSFEAIAARLAAKAKADPQIAERIAERDAWDAGVADRQKKSTPATEPYTRQANPPATQPAQFVAPADDNEIADTQWLYDNVSSIACLRLLHLGKTSDRNYTRGHVRAAAASLVSRQPGDCRMPLGVFVDALSKMQSREFTDTRTDTNIRLAKHGWDGGLYLLAGRWPQKGPNR